MATEAEREILKLALSGKLKPQHVDDVEDEAFAAILVDHTMSEIDFEDESSLDEVIIWLTEEYCRNGMRTLLENFRDTANERDVEAFAERLFLSLTESSTRDLILRIFWKNMDLKDEDLSREEIIFLLIKKRSIWGMEKFLKKYGFEEAIADTLLREIESINEFPDAIRADVARLVDTEDFSDTVLENSWDPARDLPLLPLVSRAAVIEKIQDLETAEQVETMLGVLKLCRDDLKTLGAQLEKAAAKAKPAPGRPDAKAVEEFKSLQALAKKDPHRYENKFAYMDADILSYELTLNAQETALARAIKAEENGTVTDPFKVSEIENNIVKIKAHIRFKAVKEALEQLQEATS